jgi:phenylacetate-CoA ligase
MSGILEKIYLTSPIWIQQIMVSAYGWKWHRQRYNANFDRIVDELRSHEGWSYEQFCSYQQQKLDHILRIAQGSPYYQEAFREAGIKQDESPFEILARLPFLTKQTLRAKAKDLLTQNPVPRRTMLFKSSGTTGTPTEIYYTPEFHALEIAISAVRNLGWAGVNYRERRVMFGVRKVCHFYQDHPPFWRFSPAEDMAYASIYHLSPKFLSYYIDFLKSYQPAIVMGYPSALYTIARFALETGTYPLPAKGVFTTSETVTDQMREAIQTAWNCKLFDRYGAVEGCLFVSQCEHGRYHVSPEIGVVEIVDHAGRPAEAGVLGRVVCTGLQNTLQPLIRYELGDAARWSKNQNCPCGRQMPILEMVEGRYEDICITPDGREMLRFDTVFKGVENICEAQVIQQRLDQFTIQVVPGNGFSNHDIKQLKKNMVLHVGNVSTEVNLVDGISRKRSGKFQSVICNLSPEEKELARRRNSLG